MFKVAILGCENSHANSFLKYVIKDKKYDDIEFVGIYSDDKEAEKKLTEQFGVNGADSYDAFVGKIDGLIITARHGDNHYKYAKPYIESGIPMFIDKPITVSEKEADEFMNLLAENNVRITGGSSCIHCDLIQELKAGVKEGKYGKISGGYYRAPISLNNIYGGFYFYAQHLVQIITEVHGCWPKSVVAKEKNGVITMILRYQDYDVTGVYTDGNYNYFAYVSGAKEVVGGKYDIGSYAFEKEFSEFHELLLGGKQKVSYTDFVSPVYIMNAIERSLKSGNEEKIGRPCIDIKTKELEVDNLTVKIMDNRSDMGAVAAADIRAKMKELLAEKDEINMIFAAAPSQNDVLASLVDYDDIEWGRVNAFHMDEYIGLDKNAPQCFSNYLKEHIFGKVNFKSVNYIDASATDSDAECARYTELLKKYPTDIVVMGIGENGHIAFNDPWVADFDDPKMVKAVPLDEVCRQQQVNDGCFKTIDDVPKYAVTLTCPTLFNGKNLFCIVPAKTKANAVKHTLEDAITVDCPATILRKHASAKLYLDSDSSEFA